MTSLVKITQSNLKEALPLENKNAQIGNDGQGREYIELDDAEGLGELRFKLWSSSSAPAWTVAAVITTFLALAALAAGFLVPGLAPILFTGAAIFAAPALVTLVMTIVTNICAHSSYGTGPLSSADMALMNAEAFQQ